MEKLRMAFNNNFSLPLNECWKCGEVEVCIDMKANEDIHKIKTYEKRLNEFDKPKI